MEKKIIDNIDCSGCHACYNICPQNCILMKEDGEGFLYPQIDSGQCANCGLCERVCPVLSEYKGRKIGKAYACINKNEEIRKISSSGGIFTLLAENVLDKGGIVFGVAFDDDFSVHHIEVEKKSDLNKLRGSKYLQSRIEKTYKKAEEYLNMGKTVLFTGTPCQISGIKSYLRKDYENLILQDVICHGAPSPKAWRNYLSYIQKEKKEKLLREPTPAFRRKEEGWRRYSIALYFNNAIEYLEVLTTNIYMKSFLTNHTLRMSCYNCHSKSLKRESDITLADFWGVDKVIPDMDDDKGTSLVFVNSPKGKKVFSEISENMNFREVDIKEAVKYNPSAFKSVKIPKNRKKFMKLLNQLEFDKVVKKCIKNRSWFRKLLSKCKKLLTKLSNKTALLR